jgi:L-fucono-1,5-lactonase
VRLDSHQHFWRYDPADLPWISTDMAVLQADHLPSDLAPLLDTHQIDGTIAVQARHSEDETRWLLDLANDYPFIRGVVGWVDLMAPDLDSRLDDLARPKLVGIRHIVHDEPDGDFMLQPAFRAGLARLADHDLTFDLLLFPTHLRSASTIAAEHAELSFVLDHIGKPPVAAGSAPPRAWRQDLRRLASHDNVMCKLSGMITEASWQDWSPEDFIPYLDIVMQLFGPERVMFGSDWPVCCLSGSYGAVLDVVERYASSMTVADQRAVFGGNAARFYGVNR